MFFSSSHETHLFFPPLAGTIFLAYFAECCALLEVAEVVLVLADLWLLLSVMPGLLCLHALGNTKAWGYYNIVSVKISCKNLYQTVKANPHK